MEGISKGERGGEEGKERRGKKGGIFCFRQEKEEVGKKKSLR